MMKIKEETKKALYAFFFPFFCTFVVFLGIAIYDGGIMNYCGDFNAQHLTFGEMSVEAVHSGNFGWNWSSDLGVNFMGSYTLGSPFFWLTALFPASFSPYLVGPMLALKTGVASLLAYFYIKRFVKRGDTAVLGGVLYAMSGFFMLNVMFYQFHDVFALFPLLLIALEEAVLNKRKVFFALAVGLNALVNYFFFIGEVIFLIIYFVIRMSMDKNFRISMTDFWVLAFESIVGVLLAGIIFVPGIYQVLDVPRATRMLSDTEFFVHPAERYGFIFEAIFYLPEFAHAHLVFPNADAEWTSVSLYIPLLSMAGVIAFIRANKKHWASVLTLVCGIILLIPAFNSLFVLMNENFYGRWLYMPLLVMCMMTASALESDECDIGYGNKVCGILVGVSSLLYLLHPVDRNAESTDPGAEQNLAVNMTTDISIYTYILIAISVLSVVIVAVLIRVYKKQGKDKFITQMLSAVVICGFVVNGYYHFAMRLHGPYQGFITNRIQAEVEIPDDDFFRIDANGYTNMAMMLNYPSADSFISVVPASVYSIYELLGIYRANVSATPMDMYAFHSFTSTRYAVIKMLPHFKTTDFGYVIFEEYGKSDGFTILKNDYALPMGFTYDEYVPISVAKDKLKVIDEGEELTNDRLMIAAVMLDEQQIEKYADILTPLAEELIPNETLTLERFKVDATNRIAAGVDNFKVHDNGNFSAETNFESDELVVFSVPFDKGWSCTVNGEQAEIDAVNGGFIAVRVPAGKNVLEFVYTTPGLALGIASSIFAALLLAVWYVVWRSKRYRNTMATETHSEAESDI